MDTAVRIQTADQFAAHIIPTRVKRGSSGDELTICATVVLTPVPLERGTGTFENWPIWIDRIFRQQPKGEDLIVRLRRPGSDASAKWYPIRRADGIDALARGRGTSRRALLDRANTYWANWVMAENGPGLREFLHKQALVSAGSAFKDTLQPKSGQVAAGVPDIIAVPRADIARNITLARGLSLVTRVAEAVMPDQCAALKAETQSPDAKQLPRSKAWAQVFGSKEKLVAAAQNYNPYRYEKGKDLGEGYTKLQTILQNERFELETALGGILACERKKAQAIAAAEKAARDAEGARQLCTARAGEQACDIASAARQAMEKRGAFEKRADEQLAISVASGLPDYDDPSAPVPELPDRYKTRWQSLQGAPVLARLLQLIVDIEFDVPESDIVEWSIEGAPETSYLELTLDGSPVFEKLWTLAKLRPGDNFCWPVTEEELALATSGSCSVDDLRGCGVLDQFDGVIDLEAEVELDDPAGKRTIKRYDINSLDVHFAAEAEEKRHRTEAALAEAREGTGKADENRIKLLSDKTVKDESETDLSGFSTLRTAGLNVIDRFRQGTAVAEFVASCAGTDANGTRVCTDAGRRVDANDLAIGHKLDVGVFTAAPGGKDKRPRDWRSLTPRIIEYGDFDCQDFAKDQELDELIDAFMPQKAHEGSDGEAVRRELDGAIVASATRLVRNSAENSATHAATLTAFAEETIASWNGDPMGQRTGAFIHRTAAAALPMGQRVDLAMDDVYGKRPHKLRFGSAYSFGMRQVLLGGVCRPVEAVAKLYEEGLKGGMAYPAEPTSFQRFLRQERIGPPLVAVGADLLVSEFSSKRRGLDGKEMVVRSGEAGGDDEWRFQPRQTERVLFAPSVDLNFAVLHGVYDKKASGGRPLGGLDDLEYDSDWGGFPVFDPKGPPLASAVRSTYLGVAEDKSQSKATDQNACDLKKEASSDARGTPSGFAVVKKRTSQQKLSDRIEQYYPDPAARHLMIALRRRSGAREYICGPALKIPLYPGLPATKRTDCPGYPDARAVIVRIIALTTATDPLLDHGQIFERAGLASGAAWPVAPVSAGCRNATIVTINLAPGEDFDVETWCLPEEQHLRAWFDAVETVSLLADVARGCTTSACTGLLAKLAEVKEQITQHDDWSLRRGESSIGWNTHAAIASSLHQAMLLRPVTELAAVRRLRALHAVETPVVRPQFVRDTNEQPVFRLRRLKPESLNAVLAGDEADLVAHEHEDGATELLITGKAMVDPETSDSLELRVKAVSPRGDVFDDAARGRSYEMRARGIWPKTRPGENPGDIEPVPSGSKLTYMEELFGFDVAPSGKASLPEYDALLARWTIPPDAGAEVDLLSLTRNIARIKDEAGDSKPAAARPIDRLFADTKARRLELSLAVTARTARHIPDRLAYSTKGEADRDAERRYLVGEPIRIMLPATRRPGALATRNMLPSFGWTYESGDPGKPASAARQTKVRLHINRPWWEAGTEDRLGIVVWPPNLHLASPSSDGEPAKTVPEMTDTSLNRAIVRRATPLLPGEKGLTTLDLHGLAANEDSHQWRNGFFSDADLGPGGQYVTRWGEDPVFQTDSLGWLIARSAFLDVRHRDENLVESVISRPDRPKEKARLVSALAPDIDMIATRDLDSGDVWRIEDHHKPRFVANVLMPIPVRDPANEEKDEQASVPDAPEFMLVSLITFVPKFHPDYEYWYVDIDLETGNAIDPFIRFGLVRFNPHARRALQVSAPVVEWVQVVGRERKAQVRREANCAIVTVTPSVPIGVESPKLIIRADLIERRLLPSGEKVERVIETVDRKGETQAPELAIITFKLCDDDPTLSYAVFIRELFEDLPGTYSNEPIRVETDIAEDERTIESGPRFVARLEVPDKAPGK